jgi:acetyl-CoA acetyltransferase
VSAGNPLRDRAAIVGIGATEFSVNSGRSELRLGIEATQAALEDAGLLPGDVDGMCSYGMDDNTEIELQRNLGGGELRFFSRIEYGGGAVGACLQQAAMAIATGVAKVVVCSRSMNERSGYRYGTGVHEQPQAMPSALGLYAPFGLVTPASWAAMFARRYMHEFGATSEDFGLVSVAARKHAARNPKARFYQRPITLADHQNSRWISEPLRLLDCCMESDGAVAVIITSAAHARDLRQPPAIIRAAAQGAARGQQMATGFYRDEIVTLPEMELVARELYAMAGLAPRDIQTAILYDHFTPYVLMQLEAFGFCGRGEAVDFQQDGGIEIGGTLPVNTNGGQLGEAYIHGMNGLAEAVRQIRGTSANPVPAVEPVLVTGGPGIPSSGAILGRA